jgi:transposase
MTECILDVDIAKRKFDVALLINGKLKHKVFSNNQEGFETLLTWLTKQGTDRVHVCMEASSTYGYELATYMYDAGHTVSVVNPARIKGFAQSELVRIKNDKVDAGIIARFCLAMHPEPWSPAPPKIQQLQSLVRRVDALIAMRTQELHRLGTAQNTVELSIREHIAYLIKNDPDLKIKGDLLKSIPGIGEATIAAILAELPMFERCDHVQKVVAFIGLAPRQFISGSSIKGKPRLSKIGHARLRKALYMPALVSIQCNRIIQVFYHRLKEKEKNGKVIVCAIMRKLVHLIFGILRSGKPFNPNYAPHCA